MNQRSLQNFGWDNPALAAKRKAAIAASWHRSEESRTKLSQSCKSAWTPERHAKHSARMKAYHAKLREERLARNEIRVKKWRSPVKDAGYAKVWTPERRAAQSVTIAERNRERAFLRKLQREGFTPQEITNLLLTGSTGT